MLKDLTAKQNNIIEAIKDITLAKGYPPTFRELGEEVGLKSSSTVMGYLVRLKAKGVVDWEEGKTRTLRIMENSFEEIPC